MKIARSTWKRCNFTNMSIYYGMFSLTFLHISIIKFWFKVDERRTYLFFKGINVT